MLLYLFMSTPVGWWHHHAAASFGDEAASVQVLSAGTDNIAGHQVVPGDCHVCSHHYSVFTETDFFYVPEAVQPAVTSPSAFYSGQYTAFDLLLKPNKGPPACL